MVAGSDIIFVMEKRHADAVKSISAAAGDRIVLLGGGLPEHLAPGGEIADPYNCGEEAYRHCYNAVAAAVDQLVAELGRGAG